MFCVVRQYSGEGASQLFDEIEGVLDQVEPLIRGVPGFVSYTLFRTADGGISVTVCQDKSGTDESVRIASEFIRDNLTAQARSPVVSEGETTLHLS